MLLHVERKIHHHLSVLEEIIVDMLRMKERPLLMTVFQINKDPETITGFRQKLTDALSRFTVCCTNPMPYCVSLTH
jgi:hypothetical protein